MTTPRLSWMSRCVGTPGRLLLTVSIVGAVWPIVGGGQLLLVGLLSEQASWAAGYVFIAATLALFVVSGIVGGRLRSWAATILSAFLLGATMYGSASVMRAMTGTPLANPSAFFVGGAPFLLILTSAAHAMTDLVRRRRELDVARQENRCVTCGYNLTGNVSGRCPECGEPVEASK